MLPCHQDKSAHAKNYDRVFSAGRRTQYAVGYNGAACLVPPCRWHIKRKHKNTCVMSLCKKVDVFEFGGQKTVRVFVAGLPLGPFAITEVFHELGRSIADAERNG